MVWNLYENGNFLKPLQFSNGKSQEDIVREVMDAVKNGCRVIFINGKCGTGKSAIALNIARQLGKTSIVVPGKNLQRQYKKDYEGSKYLLKENRERLKISIITGRKNHECRFLKENADTGLFKTKKEVNLKLDSVFSSSKTDASIGNIKDSSADNPFIPCKIEIKERNFNRIREYLKQNKRINLKDFHDIKDVKRASIASICPYWCPVLPSEYELNMQSTKKRYKGIDNIEFAFHQRKKGCGFYWQFNSYIESDVIVFNSKKYLLEFALKRKPLTEADVIDECDEFLDSFSNQKTINLDRLYNSVIGVIPKNEGTEKIIRELSEIILDIRKNWEQNKILLQKDILPLRKTPVFDLFKAILSAFSVDEFYYDCYDTDEESYLFDVFETAKLFEEFFDESYVSFQETGKSISVNIVTTNLEKRFKEIIDRTKVLILMSGTLHSEEVLKNIFGLKDFKIITAETKHQGEIKILRTGYEKNCSYANFSRGRVTREDYLKALNICIKTAKKPVLVHVNSFKDLPSEEEIEKLNLNALLSQDALKEIQENDNEGKLVEDFKNKKIEVLFSTRCNRGIDFPGDECNSIVFTKYPNPNIEDIFWKILRKTKPQYYWQFYNDKARRELLQRVYRGLRHKNDKIYLLSPDSRVLEAFEKAENI